VDSINVPNIRVHRFGDDSTTTIIIGTDTMHVLHGTPAFRFRELHPDSIRGLYRGDIARVLSDSFAFRLFSDSGMFRMLSDTTVMRIFSNRDGHVFSYGLPDSAFARPFDILTTNTLWGMRAVAGAELAPLNPDLASYFGTTDGVLVIDAASGTPAARAGLRGGDVIVQVNGAAVRTIVDLRRAIDRAPRNAAVALRVVRRGQQVDITLDR
jgi:membrane-associated protease RseP (regulator of RpoE activity)